VGAPSSPSLPPSFIRVFNKCFEVAGCAEGVSMKGGGRGGFAAQLARPASGCAPLLLSRLVGCECAGECYAGALDAELL